MKKNILITGNSGYIGSHLSQRLKLNYNVYGLDIVKPKCQVTDHIICDIRQIQNFTQDIDTIIHLAALVKVNESVGSPLNYYSTNLNGTTNLLHKITCKNFIFASTGSAEYCNNPYGVSKRAAEDCIQQLCNLKDIPFTIFRFYNVIGSNGYEPTNPDGLFYNLLRARQRGLFTIFGSDYNTRDGTAERDYVHVEEICAAIETAIERPANKIENLGHGKGYTVQEIVELFKQSNKMDFDILYGTRRPGDLERSVLENPSNYLPNLYGMQELVKIPYTML